MSEKSLSPVEHIKTRSNYLRGTIVESLADSATGTLAEDDTQLSKFHGFYQQDDRDLRADRMRRKLEPLHSFMIRVRVPGGIATSDQWLAIDKLARQYGNDTLRLTTRQAFQFHGVIKRDLKPTIKAINDSLLDTIAACGDVNRNVMCTPLAKKSGIHKAAFDVACKISEHLTPHTRAYHEIWLDKKKLENPAESADHEPIYGPSYLPRKFKIGMAIPPSNDIDIFSQDLGFVAIEKNGQLQGFNVTVGGGMGMTHGEAETYPRVAMSLAFAHPIKRHLWLNTSSACSATSATERAASTPGSNTPLTTGVWTGSGTSCTHASDSAFNRRPPFDSCFAEMNSAGPRTRTVCGI